MKKLILAIFFILGLSLSSFSQEISLPRHIVDSIILDLADYDHLKLEYKRQDSVLKVYEVELEGRTKELKEAKITIDQYQLLVEKLAKRGQIDKDRARKALRQVKWLKIAHILRTAAEVIVIIIIIA